MPATAHTNPPLVTIDATTLSTVRWGPLRQLFPAFVEEIELGRYLKRLLATRPCRAVQVEPHREPDGRTSTHVFDVYAVPDTPGA